MLLWVFVIHISVRMTIHVIMGFCHAHLCTNYYPYYFRISSCTSLYELLSMLLWVFVMHIFVRMTIHILMGFRHVHLCTNDYPYYSCMGLEGKGIGTIVNDDEVNDRKVNDRVVNDTSDPCTMCMTKIYNNMESRSYKVVHGKNIY